jgi:hypothetical protein
MLPLELIFQRSANGGGSFRWYHADSIHEKLSLLDVEADLAEARKEGRDAADHRGIAAITRAGPTTIVSWRTSSTLSHSTALATGPVARNRTTWPSRAH